jgi:hypothetical protein
LNDPICLYQQAAKDSQAKDLGGSKALATIVVTVGA